MFRNILQSESIKFITNPWCLIGMLSAVAFAGLKNGMYLGQAGLVITSSVFIGQEYRNLELRTSLLTAPARLKLFGAKLFLLTFVTWITGLTSFLIAREHFSLMILLSWTFIVWLSAFISMITRSQVVPLTILFSLILGFSQMLFSFFKIAKYLPDLATMNLFLVQPHKNMLNPTQGLLVQLVWVLVLSFLALIVQARDLK
ncbi:ABC transporter permease [Xylocopilactobacillus apicola]|uniref:ABC transporter permease n=1 Tax=Xylocopilactobacillus apicola TaxID=2932184 RepID=A0AAU9DRV0_9LACO|nr:ABC transporter permease [Xylocopilactobacillus apicola]BDR58699.1 ABC transporter permease [Xylocopilactobacillus apicola]